MTLTSSKLMEIVVAIKLIVTLLFTGFTRNNFPGALGLRLTSVEIPSAAIMGRSAWLNCSYDLEDDQLYSIKWYRNGDEFYRFLPNDRPPAQAYKTPGVNVDLSRSTYGSVFLRRTDLNSEGIFKCEVSAEAPSFQTVRKEKEMRVYYLPKEGPLITGTRPQYKAGDLVNVTCSSGPAKPPAQLKWFINGQEAVAEYLRPPVVTPSRARSPASGPSDPFDGLSNSSLALEFYADRYHFVSGMIKLRCSAVVSQAFSMTSEEVIVGDHAPRGAPTQSQPPSAFHEGDSPIITGGRPSYTVGDLVNVTCTSRKSKPGADLRWFINDFEADSEFLYDYPKLRFSDGSVVSILRLQFIVTPIVFSRPYNFKSGDRHEIRLKCTATLSKVINMQSQETTIGGYSGFQLQSRGTTNVRVKSGLSFASTAALVLLLIGLNDGYIGS